MYAKSGRDWLPDFAFLLCLPTDSMRIPITGSGSEPRTISTSLTRSRWSTGLKSSRKTLWSAAGEHWRTSIKSSNGIASYSTGCRCTSARPKPLNRDHLRRLKALIKRTRTPWLSDHLCWGSVDGTYSHDLLPMPYIAPALNAWFVPGPEFDGGLVLIVGQFVGKNTGELLGLGG